MFILKLPLSLSYCIRTSAAVAVIFCLGSCDKDLPTNPSSVHIRPPLTEIPADLDSVKLTVEGVPTFLYAVLELSQPQGFNGFVIINGNGKPVWYFRSSGGASGFTRRNNGNFVFLDGSGGLVEVTTAKETVHVLPQEPAPGRHIHHDVISTPNNTILFIADDWQLWKDSLTNGAALWEWIPENGTTIKRWSSFDHLNLELDRGERSVRIDWLHPNAISYGPGNNILLSLHFLNQIVSITPDFQSFEWRLGGVRATIPVVDPFSGQHCVSEISPGTILMFDNGYERTVDRYSRALELQVDGDSVRKIWEWRPARDNWSRVISSARRLPNGNTLVGFGFPSNQALGSTGPIEVYEVTRGKSVVWHLLVEGKIGSMYRTTPLDEF